MKRLHLLRSVVVALGLLCASQPLRTARAEAALTADDVMHRAVARSESMVGVARADYSYRKHTITDELSSKGDFKDRKEKLYEVSVLSGLSTLKLIQVNGQNLSAQELKKQDEREAAERAKLTDSKLGGKGDQRENILTSELVARYQFTLLAPTVVNGRKCYTISFQPKSTALPVKKLTDRFLNQVAGTVWIDAQEFEIAKAQIHLCSEVTLWGGMVGTLRRCDYTMARVRLPDGNWFNGFSHGTFEGRKLLEPMLIRTMSESSNFQKLTAAAH